MQLNGITKNTVHSCDHWANDLHRSILPWIRRHVLSLFGGFGSHLAISEGVSIVFAPIPSSLSISTDCQCGGCWLPWRWGGGGGGGLLGAWCRFSSHGVLFYLGGCLGGSLSPWIAQVPNINAGVN